jgi:hypothetical protein
VYKVVAPCVLAKDQQGYVLHKYEGQHVEWLSDDQEKHFLAEGLVEKVGNAPSEPEGGGDPDAEPGGPPAKVAPKPDWVKYAISKGADPVEAEATNKPDLIELYGG